jgi:creatinine amidohydrolase
VALIPEAYDLSRLTMDEFAQRVERATVVVMLPVGAVEPHGPHLALAMDVVISQAAAARAAALLDSPQLAPLVAPAVPYGVTRCAGSFKGAVSTSASAVTVYLQSVVRGFLDSGVAHVCLVNNHLEPEHVEAMRAVVEAVGSTQASLACPVTRRWARTLSDEFKSGACHAGRYETSIIMASDTGLVRDDIRRTLPEVPISLSEKLAAGIADFAEMGLAKAYAGDPSTASAAHGEDQLQKLAEMIVAEVREALAGGS